ncbi:MAG TPA: class III poly(R)-hydroxyalkanoic acid synthase subunit PhaC [Verrucomicrobiae bacterium]|nr:class III poly(R)-hydroxyalkanoic acid synthase subunit PhaC [Verrucomicrobiae bacterium]
MSDYNVINNPWFRWQRSMIDEGFSQARRMVRLPYLFKKAQAVKKGASPSEVVYEEDRLKLLHYLSDTEPRYKTPLIFVFALVNRPYILDLKEGRSVVSHFVKAGFDTYLIDWGAPTHADRHLSLDDYINGYMMNVVDHVRERTGAPQASILGYCMGGTMSAMFTALHQEKVKNLLLLAAGIDFATREGLLNLWSDADYFDVDRFVEAFGNAPAEFLQATFQLLKPVQNLIEKPINFYEKAEDDKFVDDFFTMETWLNDNIAVPGGVFREFVKGLYQKNLLVKNSMPVGKHIVDLRKITCPVLNIMAQNDDLVPCAQSAPFNDLVGSRDRKSIVVPAGHIGLAVGSKAQKEAWPEACRWLAERSR